MSIVIFVFSLLWVSQAYFTIPTGGCFWQVNPNPGQFGSVCGNGNTTSGTNPSADCGYNYVCGYDPTVCVIVATTNTTTNVTTYSANPTTQTVCTTYQRGSIGLSGVSGALCNADSKTGCTSINPNSNWQCVNTALGQTQQDLKSYTFTYGTTWTQSVLGMSISDLNGNTYTGVCVSPPPTKTIQNNTYSGGSGACSAHNDCKWLVYNKGNPTGGNNFGSYLGSGSSNLGNLLCSNSNNQTCAQTASCHPVAHLCEILQTSYFNTNCASCSNTCGGQGTATPCGENYVTCSNGIPSLPACVGTNPTSACC